MRKLKNPKRSIRIGRWNLNSQMLLGFSLVMLITLSLAYQINYSYISEILKNKHHQTTMDRMKQVDVKFQLFLQNADSVLNYLLNDTYANKLSKMTSLPPSMDYNEYLNYSSLLEDLLILKKNNDFIYSIYIYTGNGYVVGINGTNRTAKNTEDVPIKQTAFFTELFAQPFQIRWADGISEIILANMPAEPETAQNTITVGKCYKNVKSGSTVAALVSIKASSLQQLYEPLLDSKTDTAFIVNEQDVILVSSIQDLIGKSCGYGLSTRGGDSGQFETVESGKTMQVVYYKLENYDWYIAMQTPDDAYKSEIFSLQKFSTLIFIACFIFTVFFVMLWIRNATKPLSVLCQKMDEVGKGNFGVKIDMNFKNEFGSAISNFNIMSENLARLDRDNKIIEQQRREQELKALRTQINPHFIYNTLNMIKWMAVMQKADNIADCIITLAEILKPVFKASNELVTLADEVEYLQSYIKILNYRLNHVITFQVCYDRKYNGVSIPRFTLQPLVENSVQHGNYSDGQPILIGIGIDEEEDDLVISITDNGQGIPKTKITEIQESLMGIPGKDEYENGEKVGIYNVNKRIKLNYGERYGLDIYSTGKTGTTISIRIPMRYAEE